MVDVPVRQVIHGALLAVRGNEKHDTELKQHSIAHIDLVVVNLYPFQATVDKVRCAGAFIGCRSLIFLCICSQGSDFDTCIENIDIGMYGEFTNI